jgi:hypothetical protein
MSLRPLFGRRYVDVPCTLEIEQTQESLHAYATPDGIDIQPGDTVLIHGAPDRIGFGERYTCECRATIVQAGLLGRLWTQMTGLLELTELYEVGFLPKGTP